MKAHHEAWLLAHPDWDEAKFRRILDEGFDIHHIDGDRQNNEPTNLVMIEHGDHWMLHGGKRQIRPIPSARCGPREATLALGKEALPWREAGYTWRELGEKLGKTPMQLRNAVVAYKRIVYPHG